MINGRVPYNETMNKKVNDVFPLPPMNKVHIQKEDTLKISTSDIKEGDYSGTLVYDMDATCGTDDRDIYFTQEDIIGSVNLPGINKESKIIRANGDSMEPKVYDGNMVVIREIHNWDDIFYGQSDFNFYVLNLVSANKDDTQKIIIDKIRSEINTFITVRNTT